MRNYLVVLTRAEFSGADEMATGAAIDLEGALLTWVS